MTPTVRAAALLAAVGLLALLLEPALSVLLALAVIGVVVADALFARRAPRLRREHPALVPRGVGVPLRVTLTPLHSGAAGAGVSTRVRQPRTPELSVEPPEATGELDAVLRASRRGRHVLPALACATTGPLRLGRWHHRAGDDEELLVYPDLPAARRLALQVRMGRLPEAGRLVRGPLGLGTDFESVRDYFPDDDIRQLNPRASARLGRPMSNQYRVEQDREVIGLMDCGRLMAAPLGPSLTRLDAALDALCALAAVADELGDRCGGLAFDDQVRRQVRPRRAGGGRAVVHAFFDLEPSARDSDYELAFRTLRATRRALIVILTDLLDEAAARPLREAVPLLTRRHAVVVASATDPDIQEILTREPAISRDAYASAVALDVLQARERAAVHLRRAGAEVLEAPPAALGAACVRAYMRAKARARL